ncbi:MAG TPA: hypothetical protein VMZ74_08375 [Ramlibacter sp.]|nr:hypothetical protein [Ramlibacter sp.]
MRTAVLVGASLALAAPLLSLPAFAGPSDYVYTPKVEYGEREIDFKYGTAKNADGTRSSAGSVGFGWGVTEHWFTEVYGKWHKEPGDTTGFDAFEWENKFQLTETGKYPVDIGFILEIERPKDRSEGYEVRWGPLFQMDITPMWQANLNILVEKHYRAAAPSPAELGYQWQVKYRYKRELEFGLQGFGDVGPLNHWEPGSEQPHIAGPAIFGKFNAGTRQVINYNAAVLFGLTRGAPKTTFRMQAEYEF